MTEQFSRTALLIGEEAINKLNNSHVIVFGVGGVGGYVVEALVRAGIGELSIVDNDVISQSNLNRQIIALNSTIGLPKVQIIAQRALDINPNLKIHQHQCFFLPENSSEFDFSSYDYVVDCIDTVTAKIEIIKKVKEAHPQSKNKVPGLITCLGTGNKLNPMGFKVSKIEKTSVCPLAKVMRNKLKELRISGVKCVYSEEQPIKVTAADSTQGRHSPGSISFVPPAAGLLIASEVIKDLTSEC